MHNGEIMFRYLSFTWTFSLNLYSILVWVCVNCWRTWILFSYMPKSCLRCLRCDHQWYCKYFHNYHLITNQGWSLLEPVLVYFHQMQALVGNHPLFGCILWCHSLGKSWLWSLVFLSFLLHLSSAVFLVFKINIKLIKILAN